jgi:rfaE bifunctional protein kinase chain/domain
MTGKMQVEAEVAKEVGTRLAFTGDIVFSSTHLINTYLSSYPEEMREYLDVFRTRHSVDEVLRAVEAMQSLRVLVIGDTIIDEYVYGEAIGKSSKDPVLALQYKSEDRFAGGVLAVANHVAGFAGEVELVTMLGAGNSYESFIRASLNPRIKSRIFECPGVPTVCKRRYIEGYALTKLLEIYVMDERPLAPAVEDAVVAALGDLLPRYDVVVAADFGHGLVTPRVVGALCSGAKFLAVNTQANAGNRGFHTISRYPRADYVCIAEHEIRLDRRDSRGELRPMMEKARDRLGCRYLVVTCGRRGCCVCTDDRQFVTVPSFARNVVDRVGAGDAFLAVTALAAVAGVDFEILGFIGNVVGAEAVQIVGNAKAIDQLAVKKHISSLLK